MDCSDHNPATAQPFSPSAPQPLSSLSKALRTVELHLRKAEPTFIASPSAPQPLATQQKPTASDSQPFSPSTPRMMYVRSPQIPKALWTELGNQVAERERKPYADSNNVSIPGHRWISLRLDGSGFSRFTKLLRHEGVLKKGYNREFAEMMVECAKALMDRVNGYCVYTQSDEMTVLIAARSLNEKTGEYHPHEYNGRVQKLASQAASFVASRFNWLLWHLFIKKGLLRNPVTALSHHDLGQQDEEDVCRESQTSMDHNSCEGAQKNDDTSKNTDGEGNVWDDCPCLIPTNCLATFDCRVASYESLAEAMSVLLWRSYDCGVNGVSDEVHHLKGDQEKLNTADLHKQRSDISGKDVGSKLQWLNDNGWLPLPDHQAYGSFFCSVRRKSQSRNHKTGEMETKLRRRRHKVEGNVILNFLNNSLLLQDDVL